MNIHEGRVSTREIYLPIGQCQKRELNNLKCVERFDLLNSQEMIMRLDQYAKDFKSLIERLQLMKAFENAEEGSRLVAPSVLVD